MLRFTLKRKQKAPLRWMGVKSTHWIRPPSLFYLVLPSVTLLLTLLHSPGSDIITITSDEHLLSSLSPALPTQRKHRFVLDSLVGQLSHAPKVPLVPVAKLTPKKLIEPGAVTYANGADVAPSGGLSLNGPVNAGKVVNKVQEELLLRRHLNFTTRSVLNFMHFHKTGGVSYKTALYSFFNGKTKANGTPVRLHESCYQRSVGTRNGQFLQTWRCDWDRILAMKPEERSQLDVVFGHQYWVGGVAQLLKQRDVRTFAVLRHPLSRKLSFFYHFFVREQKRKEADIRFDEVRAFLLYNNVTVQGARLGQEIGPNYMAGHLLSNGEVGFVGDSYYRHFEVRAGEERMVTKKSMRIMRDYVFLGIQSERAASTCMLSKTVNAFSSVHGIKYDDIFQKANNAPVLNTGSYALTAAQVWQRFTPQERQLFKRTEQVDLDIYKQSVRLFLEHVRLFGCEALVVNKRLGEGGVFDM